jgi:3-mercaptopyruvate sulfurtransferase SseA
VAQATSTRAVDEFERMGFTNVRYLIAGVDNWKKTGLPLAAETAEQPGHHPTA